MSWYCIQCTFENHESLSLCEMCDAARASTSTSTSTSNSVALTNTATPAAGVFSSISTTSSASASASTKGPVIEILDGEEKEGEEDEEQHWWIFDAPNNAKKPRLLSSSSSGMGSGGSGSTSNAKLKAARCQFILENYKEPHRDANLLREATTGILDLVEMVTKFQQVRVSVARPYCLHFSQAGSFGANWSCGYRNIQMISSCLMGVPEFQSVLFGTDGIIPPIFHIQQYIEQAWKQGFDPEGGTHFNNNLAGSSEYIGTTECAALLRSFRIRAIVVDFPSHLYLAESKSSSDEEKDAAIGSRIFAWVKKYFKHKYPEAPDFKSNLYFQHDGHSRTIAGVKWNAAQNGEDQVESLILFDPFCKARSIKDSLLDGSLKWQRQLYRQENSFKKAEYQILYVAPGLMDDEEYERSKSMLGESEFAEIRNSIALV